LSFTVFLFCKPINNKYKINKNQTFALLHYVAQLLKMVFSTTAFVTGEGGAAEVIEGM
jgi:hypothetical protein